MEMEAAVYNNLQYSIKMYIKRRCCEPWPPMDAQNLLFIQPSMPMEQVFSDSTLGRLRGCPKCFLVVSNKQV